MAGRPPKPVQLLKLEGKSHRTKAELAVREEAESQLLTGISMQEWPDVASDELAHKEFVRVKNLLQIISHDDALHEAVINRYCILASECKHIEQTMIQMRHNLEELAQMKATEEIDAMTYLQERGNIQDRMIAWDKKLMDKRKMLLQIEKESVMTILSALRSIPKKPQEQKDSPMAEYLRKKREG